MALFRYLIISAVALAGCSQEPTTSQTTLTGSAAAVAGRPKYQGPERYEVESCCTLKLASSVHSKRLQGIDSIVQDVSGPGYILHIVFGPYDSSQAAPGYHLADKQIIDGVTLSSFQWTDHRHQPPEGQLLWLAQVGGGKINGVNHAAWGLRISSDCETSDSCHAATALVKTIRF